MTTTSIDPTEAELSDRLAALREQKRAACEAEIEPLMKRHGCSIHVRLEASPDLRATPGIHADGSDGSECAAELNDLLAGAGCVLDAEVSISTLRGRVDLIHVRLKQ